ncbi:hypothetical protein MKEN_00251000 [Mycena kentingensis (nom. inval.)]|nr:hypothetical protein MKEN_00251000 [Mycena kentingensis (nom. inval.)]
MPLLCFRFPSPSSRRSRKSSDVPTDEDDAHSILDILDLEIDAPSPRISAEQPPPLSSATIFDNTFPRIVFGGYRRYYECAAQPEQANPNLPPIKEEPYSWQSLHFSGKQRRRRRRTSSTPSSIDTSSIYSHNPPQLREKPRIRSMGKPLVDLSYPWPDWLRTAERPAETQ